MSKSDDEIHADLEDAYEGRPRRRFGYRNDNGWRWLAWWCIIALSVWAVMA